jgi:hypothetical protein
MLNYLALLVLPFDLYDIELLVTCIASAGELARKKLSLFPSISNMYKQLDKDHNHSGNMNLVRNVGTIIRIKILQFALSTTQNKRK